MLGTWTCPFWIIECVILGLSPNDRPLRMFFFMTQFGPILELLLTISLGGPSFWGQVKCGGTWIQSVLNDRLCDMGPVPKITNLLPRSRSKPGTACQRR